MTRIPENEIERIKTDIDLTRLIEAQGYVLKKHGKEMAVLCPFHDDNNPSLIISPSKNVFHCFGCGASGTVIDWVMKTQAVSFKHALEILKQGAVLEKTKPVKRSVAPKLVPVIKADAQDHTLLNTVIDYYHNNLKQTPDALAYLKQRGLHHPELIDTFKLGYCNRTLGYRLLSRDSSEGQKQREQLQRLGLLRDSGHEHFNGCLTIPILDERGQVMNVYGRRVKKIKHPDQHPPHYYLPGPHRGIFNVAGLHTTDELILCEALIDALTFWCNGFRNVTASYGVNGFTDAHLNALKANKIQRVLIAYDRDDAGNTAAETLAKKLNAEHIDCYRILFPKGMDANAYALTLQPAQKALSLVIRKAEWIGRGPAKNKMPHDAVAEKNNPPDKTQAEQPDIVTDPFIEITQINAEPLERAVPENVSPHPKAPVDEVKADITDQAIKFTFSNRHYRLRGMTKTPSYDSLKINLLVKRDDGLHSDILDLYSAKQRSAFIKQASIELGVDSDLIKKDLGQLLLKLEALQDEQIKQNPGSGKTRLELSEPEHTAAMELLKDKHVLNRILDDFNTCGVIGEETNKLVGYLACVSRKLAKPLAIIIQSSSAAGKSSLMDAILNFIPEEERIQYSAMTGQSLFYMGETDLKHKILAIAEEEGANQASYALKLLQSEGEITIASTGKDEATGNLVTKEYKVEGPVMLFLTTTAIDIDEELMNRCLVLTVNESRAHTQAIHHQQRFDETLEGLLASAHKNELINLHRNAQRLLKPLNVVNPFAQHLTFLNDKTRTRRDHKKYLMLIRSIALLHQYQREIKRVHHQGNEIEYIEVTLDDIETANKLAHDVLGRSLDELPPQTRRLLKLIHQYIETECEVHRIDQSDVRFTRKALRESTGWGNTQLKLHLARLVELEYLLIHGGHHQQRYQYELLYDGNLGNDQSHMMGLIDINTLQDTNRSGQTDERSGCGRPVVGVQSGSGRTLKKAEKPSVDNNFSLRAFDPIENAYLDEKTNRSRSVAGS